MSTLIICGMVSPATDTICVRVHPGKRISQRSPTLNIALDRILAFDPQYSSIPLGLPEDVEIMAQLLQSDHVVPAARAVRVLVGEVDMTNDRDVVVAHSTTNELIKGAHIQPFYVRAKPKQGSQEWINESAYLRKYRGSPKERAYNLRRPIMQGITGTDDSRRIKAAMTRPGQFLANSVNYVLAARPGLSEWFLLAWLNSSFTEWRFRLTSTNNNVNNYEVEALPFPRLPELIAERSERLTSDKWTECVVRFLKGEANEEALVAWANVNSRTWLIHEQVGVLCTKLVEYVEAFEAEKQTFRSRVLRALGSVDGDDFTAMAGKTTIDDCVPDFRTMRAPLSFDEVAAVVRKNRIEKSRGASDRAMDELGRHYAVSVEERLRVRSQIALADTAIDMVLGGACGLAVNQIQWIREQVRLHARAEGT